MNAQGLELAGRRLLVAEDVSVIAFDLADLSQELGCTVLGPAPSVEDALSLLQEEERPDLALLDAELADGSVAPLAARLRAMGVPFAVITGHTVEDLPDEVLRTAPCLVKPYSHEEVEATLLRLLCRAAEAG
jgi:DNA-binding response OmpR family regulator